jgi:hypothetical protein
MKQSFWQRIIGHSDALVPPPVVRGTTIVREERGSGAGAVLFRPYAVSEFVPDAASDPDTPAAMPRQEAAPADEPTVPSLPVAVAGDEEQAGPPPGDRTQNPVAEQWRRANPDMFQSVARRFRARAPVAARELREYCLTGQERRLVKLAASLKPTLGLYDLTAADAAERVERAVAEERHHDLPREVLALEHELWRVAAAWQTADQPPGISSVEVVS